MHMHKIQKMQRELDTFQTKASTSKSVTVNPFLRWKPFKSDTKWLINKGFPVDIFWNKISFYHIDYNVLLSHIFLNVNYAYVCQLGNIPLKPLAIFT